jgi:hypothetical protein
MFVDVEQSPLLSSSWRPLGFIDRRFDSVSTQDAGKRQAAKAGTDDSNSMLHVRAPSVAPASSDAGACFRRRWLTMRTHGQRIFGDMQRLNATWELPFFATFVC